MDGSTVEELSQFWSDDRHRYATVMKYETRYLVQMCSVDNRTLLMEYDTRQQAEDKAEDWCLGEL